MPSGSFLLIPGAIITLPDDFKVEESRNKERFPETPQIMTAYRLRGDQVCYYSPAHKRSDQTKRVGIFVSAGVKPGDQLSIKWVEGLCAEAELLA